MKFTIETGTPSLNFLDLTVHLVLNHNSLTPSFNIFRKPTFTGAMIHGSSFHPHNHRRAGILALIHRLITIPLPPTEFTDEIKNIEYLASLNHVDINIKKVIRRKLYRKLIASHPPPPHQQTTSTHHLGPTPVPRQYLIQNCPYPQKIWIQTSLLYNVNDKPSIRRQG